MNFLRRNSVFLTLCLMLIVALGICLLYIPKAELHLFLCDRHTPILDTFYKYYTQIGEWVPYIVCIALLFYKAGWAAFTLSGTLLSGLVTQILKHIVNAPRPLTYFSTNCPDIQLPLVEGVTMSRFYSFPSGHTTTFFALFFALCIIGTNVLYKHINRFANLHTYKFTNCFWQAACFFFAALGGYSRIYLSQHFASDVLGGLCVGLLITGLLYIVFYHLQYQNWFNRHFFAKKMR